MTHRSKDGAAAKDAGGARAGPEEPKGIAQGAASKQELKKPKPREEKEGKAVPTRGLSMSEGSSLTTPASLVREGPNPHITTTTSTSTPGDNFEPGPARNRRLLHRKVRRQQLRRPGRRDRRFCGCNASAK